MKWNGHLVRFFFSDWYFTIFLCFLIFSHFPFLFYLSKSATNLFYSDRKRRIYDAPLQMRSNNGQQPFGKKRVICKGQLISKTNCQGMDSSKKRRNEFVLLLCDVFSFVFWKKLKTPKKPFEITWPLNTSKF